MIWMRRVHLAVLGLVVASAVFADDHVLRLGTQLSDRSDTKIGEILENPDVFHDRVVRIEGRIASVCTQEGCFIEVVPETGGGEGIVVNFPGLAHTFPLDCAGREVVVEGRFYQKIYPHERVHHWQHHSFRPGIPIPDSSLAYRMDAFGAEIRGSAEPPPRPARIKSASADRVNLDRMGFEAEDFGIDRRNIEPGEVVPRPSTGGNRWMVIVRVGEIELRRADGRSVSLVKGQLSFLSAGVDFEIHNPGRSSASFDLVYSKKIEREEPHHR